MATNIETAAASDQAGQGATTGASSDAATPTTDKQTPGQASPTPEAAASAASAASAAAPKAPNPPADPADLPPSPADVDDATKLDNANLSPQDMIDFQTAKMSYTAAYQKFVVAKATAVAAFNGNFAAFAGALQQFKDADAALSAAGDAANAKADAIAATAAALKKVDAGDANATAAALKMVQAAVDDYKAAAADAVVKTAAKSDRLAALAKLGAVPFDAAAPQPDPTAAELALSQYSIDLAKARIPLMAAYDDYLVALAKIRGHSVAAPDKPILKAA